VKKIMTIYLIKAHEMNYTPPIDASELSHKDAIELSKLYIEWVEEGNNILNNDEWKQNYALMAAFLMLPGHYTEQ
jgi:hypothetical protein